jgi:hypothetical protein
MNERPLKSDERRMAVFARESIWFWIRRRQELFNRDTTQEVELQAAALRRLIRQCGDDETAALQILQEEMKLMEEEYQPKAQEVRRRIRRKESITDL